MLGHSIINVYVYVFLSFACFPKHTYIHIVRMCMCIGDIRDLPKGQGCSASGEERRTHPQLNVFLDGPSYYVPHELCKHTQLCDVGGGEIGV